jgi:hypothetical protein
MSEIIQIKRKLYISFVWHILEKYFQRNKEHRGAFKQNQGTIGVYSKCIAADAYFYIIETYLNDEKNLSKQQFEVIRPLIYNIPKHIKEFKKSKIAKWVNLNKVASIETASYLRAIENLLDYKSKLKEKEEEINKEIDEFNKKIQLLNKPNSPAEEKTKNDLIDNVVKKKEEINALYSAKSGANLYVNVTNLKAFIEPGLIPVNFSEKFIETKLSAIDLEVLSFYAFDMPFKDFITQGRTYSVSKKSINLIHTELSIEFKEIMSIILEAFEAATHRGASKAYLDSKLTGFKQLIESSLYSIKEGIEVLQEEVYFTELKNKIEKCSHGIGVTIPAGSGSFDEGKGAEILLVNKKQAAKEYPVFTETKYSRIFVLKSESPDLLDEIEQQILLNQLKHDVFVYTILTSEIEKLNYKINIANLDFALLKVNDSTILATTYTDESEDTNKVNGTFLSHKEKACTHYNQNLKELLEDNNLKKYKVIKDKETVRLEELDTNQVGGIIYLIDRILR